MAKVLDIQEITLPSTLSDSYTTSGYFYNGYYYINTSQHIYKYDHINNVLTILYNKTNSTNYNCWGINDNIYMYYSYLSGSSTFMIFYYTLYVYNITNNTYTKLKDMEVEVTNIPERTMLNTCGSCIFSLDNKHIVLATSMYSYKQNGTSFSNYLNAMAYCIYDIENNTYKSNYIYGFAMIHSQPIINNNYYYYNMIKYGGIYQDNPDYFKKRLGYLYQNKTGSTINTQLLADLDFDIRYHGVMLKEDNVYYLIGGRIDDTTINKKIYELNLTSQTLTETTYVLPNDFDTKNSWFVQGANEGFMFTKTKAYKFSFIEYNNIYNISNSKGDFIYQTLTEQSPITKLKFTQSGDKIGYNFTTITGDVTGTYTPQIPSGYKLIGYSPSPNSTKAIIPLDTEITYNVLEDFTFYEVYGKYRPIDTPFSIKLYQNKAEANRVDKTNYITLVKEVLGVLRESTSIIDFSVVLELDTFPNFNYVYIEIFNRYYFVSDIVSFNKNIWEVSLSCDVLMSYKDAINACTGFVDRNENTYNLLIVDDKLPLKQGQTISTTFVNNTLFDDIQGTYVLQGLLVTQGDIVTPVTQTTETTTKEDK